jgi:hypothetical protein
MSSSAVILICGCVLVILGLLHSFFGYKLARFLLPVSGTVLAEGLLYLLVYENLKLDSVSTWLFFVGSSIAIYLVLFFFKRIAGFFLGMAAGGMVSVLLVYVLGMQTMPLVYPVCLTISVMVGLFTLVYERNMVVASTTVGGACVAAYSGLFLLLNGVDPTGLVIYNNLLVPLEVFLRCNTTLIGGVVLVLIAAGMSAQFFWTAGHQILSTSPSAKRAKRRNEFVDSI